jgi:hypothetical protein
VRAGLLSAEFAGFGVAMAEPYSRIENLYLSSALANRTRFYSEADRAVLATIRCGVLFAMAFWSGHARKAFQELKRVLEEADPDGKLELVVVDADGCPDIYDLPEFVGKMHGAGETAWVREGKVIRTSGLGYHPECFEPNTRLLLEECQATVTV